MGQFYKLKYQLTSRGNVILDVGNINLVACGSESIKSVPLAQNYEFINVGRKVSWDYSHN